MFYKLRTLTRNQEMKKKTVQNLIAFETEYMYNTERCKDACRKKQKHWKKVMVYSNINN